MEVVSYWEARKVWSWVSDDIECYSQKVDVADEVCSDTNFRIFGNILSLIRLEDSEIFFH